MPIDGENIESLKGGFAETRGGGRPHEAVDMLAPRNTPVHAVENGTIAKLFTSKAGGLTIYQFDPAGRLCYYYAHLERYADGLKDGQAVSQGDVIGYVGTSGNAPPNTPHLHFAVFELNADKRWWQGRPIDPYLVFKSREHSLARREAGWSSTISAADRRPTTGGCPARPDDSGSIANMRSASGSRPSLAAALSIDRTSIGFQPWARRTAGPSAGANRKGAPACRTASPIAA